MIRTRTVLCVVSLALAGLVGMPASPAAAPPAALTRGDLRWLARVTFGIDTAIVARFRALGRVKFLDEQLHPPSSDPTSLAAAIAAIPVTQQTAEARVAANRASQQLINTLTNEDDKQKARDAINQAGNQVVYETTKRQLMRALESPSQMREQMTWFWMNHFSVFFGKANVRWTLAEYEEQVVRAHALGKFSDLVLATATSPAMLEYLDNAQSAVGKINENYARELMELHTLGVSGGPSGSTYTQADVQELARVLTGAGLNLAGVPPKVPANQQALYLRRGLFEFNPARHDFGAKTLLGRTIAGKGLPELDAAVALLCAQPATARYISTKLATYFIADEPPPPLVARMTRTFQKTDGSIPAVLREMFLDPAFIAGLNAQTPALEKFKDPMQFVVSSMRLAYDGKTITNYRPAIGWLQQLGEPLYGRVTPDGYPLTEAAWSSSGQMVRRFEIARAIGSGNAGLFNNDDNTPGPTTGFPMLTSRLFFDAIDPALGARAHDALARTSSQQEWNMILLASPDWMQR
ncbi:MAG TPA: DUF1800 domain-containing protein [Vicinamibacterales bacterium]|jgi:uncharacterized protein (DUF1800 family)|nr:DUF1800 domain-containing protein [Vicinamibacterales bacterium]